MSTISYPGFYSLNHPEPESQDQVVNPHPSFEGAAWHDDLMATLLFEQYLTFTGQCNDLANTPTENIPSVQQTAPVEQLPPPTHKLAEPIRLKQTHPRVLHACDYCRYRKTKVRSFHYILLRSLTIEYSVPASSRCVRVAKRREGLAPGLP